MKAKEAVKIVTECARNYDLNLARKNILFIYGSQDNPEYMECTFSPRNYLHLTGIRYSGSAIDFYRECLSHKLSPNAIEFAPNGMTHLKLHVLPQIVSISP